ncbi:hypothetical protein J3R30DRAFT_3523946 [Lentinula aciculospora]|uniref:Uncharacterized protein n=1 Tax=Lentinula aciculospora TaxID=153920 RepID=A0A9W9A1I1_9AGAR|nr:hypothetical protein J3R30DRAFT_3523946 [Lentinula aciculospora]
MVVTHMLYTRRHPLAPRLRRPAHFQILHRPPLHPFAGSAKQVKKFRMHERKAKRSLSPPNSATYSPTNSSSKKFRYMENDEYEEQRSSMDFKGLDFDSKTDFDPDAFSRSVNETDPQKLFQEVVDRAYADCSLHINFERQNLCYIPEEAICDLNNIVILDQYSEHNFVNPDTIARRSVSTDLSYRRRRSQTHRLDFSRTSSTRIPGVPREHMTLLLADNCLSHLPFRLFHLSRLTVLSLRANNLTVLPPEICLLTSLKELNVANNKLNYVPAEMMQMKLSRLSVQPNPFLPVPPSETPFRRTLSRSRTASKSHSSLAMPKPVSPIKTLFPHGVPSLFELCLRASTTTFPSPLRNTASPETFPPKVGLVYELPAESNFLPQLVKHRLHLAVPGLIKDRSANVQPPSDSDEVTGVGFCPSPHHRTYGVEVHRTLFYQHVEERFTWENAIAGVEKLGDIPVKWRGCQKGCLAFLDHANMKDASSLGSVLPSTLEVSAPSSGFPSNEVGSLEDIVKPINLAQVSFTEEDFDDE